MKCIYCLLDKKESDFRKREHVIPQCLGRFSNNLLLNKFVCDDCNQYFGDKVELFLGRDSLESILRLQHGLRPKDCLKKRKRVKSKINDGPFKGVILREHCIDDSGKMFGEKVVQAGFYHKEKMEYEYFELGDIPFSTELIERGYEIKNCTIWLIGDIDEVKLLKYELEGKGIPLKNDEEVQKVIPDGIFLILAEATLDRVIMRGICKIAFNYLAYIAGKHFVLNKNFNEIRKFIRYDQNNEEEYLSVNQLPILHDDQWLARFAMKVTIGHLIVLEWKGKKIVSKVGLFNTHTYLINLCKSYDGIWIPLTGGHHFDIENKEVTKLLSIPKRLIP